MCIRDSLLPVRYCLPASCLSSQSKRLPRFSRERSLKASGVVGRKIGPNVLWSSDAVKLSHSCTRTRSMLPLAGARPEAGFWSARYCTVSYTHLDAADDLTRVDLGGRRIIKKKK